MKLHEYCDVNLRGKITDVEYTTTNRQGEIRTKTAHVYTPKDYYDSDPETRYNIMYLVHGGGGSADAWLDACYVKNMLDQAIDKGEVEPLIVVFCSFYKERISRIGNVKPDVEREHVMFFQKELADELIPAVESRFRTFCESTDHEGIVKSRDHRCIAGFSMGSATTWFAFAEHMDCFAWYMPLSGDSWAIEAMGGSSYPAETAEALYKAVCDSGYTAEDFTILAATGTEDPAYTGMVPQLEEMKKYPEVFRYSDDYSEGNLHFLVGEGMHHCYPDVYQYLYNLLPYLFKK